MASESTATGLMSALATPARFSSRSLANMHSASRFWRYFMRHRGGGSDQARKSMPTADKLPPRRDYYKK